eukprot:TRINITY_DN17853_c0_g1_i4.p1 TRINITY_DN17853_c0_g1~~TRINITY_DN17853_c0_g1_i4.p1  ORF type:complete len:348 (+),score=101.66 TRINITY_DN17853_c0_g1_i4:199-1242(+)
MARSEEKAKRPKAKKDKKRKTTEQPAPAEQAANGGSLADALFGNAGAAAPLAGMFAAPKTSKFARPVEPLDRPRARATEDPPEEPEPAEATEQQMKPRPKISKERKREEAEKLGRTIFVGNVPAECIKKQAALKRLFLEFGQIEAIRFRSIAFAEGTKHRRSAVITGQELSARGNCNAYIVFTQADQAQAAVKDGNGKELMGLTLRVDMATAPGKHEDKQGDHRKGIFLGNLPFDVTEQTVRAHFDNCGKIENVRVVRDRGSNLGKGIAYVQFGDRDAVALAVELHDSKIGGRQIRVSRIKKQAPSVFNAVSYTHLRAHETPEHLVCRLLLEKKKKKKNMKLNCHVT